MLILTIGTGCGLITIQERPSTGIDEDANFGPPLKAIRIEGLGHTKESVVLRQLASKIGEPYTIESAYQDYRNLDQLRIFSSVNFSVEPDGDGVVLVLTLTEVNPYSPSVKVYITDENGVSLGLGGSSANFLGQALKATASVNVGGQTGVRLGLASPWRPGRLVQYDLRFSQQIRDNISDNFREDALEARALAQTNIGKNFRLGGFFDFFSIGSDVDGITLSETNRDNVPRLGVLVGHDSRDFPRSPTSGWYVYLDAGKSGGFLGGPADYWRGNLDIRGYWSPWDRHTLALFSFNTATTGVVGVDVPLWDDFHIGGTNTVRGWKYGARVGKDQSIATVEYRFLLLDPRLVQFWYLKMDMGIQLAAFVDAGTAWNTEEKPIDEFISGFGIGIRLLLPSINMIRFDFGVGQPSAKVTFHIGSYTKASAQRERIR